jgi:ribose transport system permease protein
LRLEEKNTVLDVMMNKINAALHHLKLPNKKNNTQSVLGVFFAFILLCIVMTILSPIFLTTANIINVLQQISINAIIAVGMTFVLLLGGIDLSVGAIVAFTGLIMAILMKDCGINLWVAIIIGMIGASLLGYINGFLIAKFKLPPFIATLGMLSIARGAAYTISNGQPIYSFPEEFLMISGKIWIIPIPLIIMLVVFFAAWYILKYTKLGRYTYAIGGNETASILSGINEKRYKKIVYTISGICCGISSVLLTSKLDAAVPVAADGYELDAIAAVVIGGTSMMGGEGKLVGTFIGALIIGVISNGLNLLSIAQGPQRMVKGAIIVIAVTIDVIRKNRRTA